MASKQAHDPGVIKSKKNARLNPEKMSKEQRRVRRAIATQRTEVDAIKIDTRNGLFSHEAVESRGGFRGRR